MKTHARRMLGMVLVALVVALAPAIVRAEVVRRFASSSEGSVPSLVGDDVHVHRRSLSKETVRSGEIEKLTQALSGGAAENDLGDVRFPYNLGYCFRDSSSACFRPDNLGAQILREFKIGSERFLPLRIVICSGVHIDHVELGAR
jgi:hypothetical protein